MNEVARPSVTSFAVRILAVIGVLSGGLLLLDAILPAGAATALSTLIRRIVGGMALTALVTTAVVLMARRIDRRPLTAIGMAGAGTAWRGFVTGALAWLVPAALALTVLGLLGEPLRVTAPAGTFWGVLALVALAVLLTEALPEELVFRGYVTRVLAERWAGWTVILVQSVLFATTAALLRGGAGVADLSLFLGMGIGLGYLRMVTGDVATAVGFHTAFQTGSQLVLTHEAVELPGTQLMAMLALGAVPFALASIGVAVVAARQERRTESRMET